MKQQRTVRRTGLVAIGAALCIAGCGGYITAGTTAYGGGPRYSQWQSPQYFSARVNERLDTIEQRVREDIATGQLRAESINEFNQRKYQVQQQLAQFGSDGVIDSFERQQIRANVRAAADIGAVQTVTDPNGYGYSTRSYYDSSWQWGE